VCVQGFLDSPFIEAVYLSELACPLTVSDEPLLAGNTESRGTVNYFVDPEDRPGCPLAMPGRAVPLIQKNAWCGRTFIEGEFRVLDVDWEPKCLVVVIAPDSRKLLFEELTVCLPLWLLYLPRLRPTPPCSAPLLGVAY
jgi:hypothetical protein